VSARPRRSGHRKGARGAAPGNAADGAPKSARGNAGRGARGAAAGAAAARTPPGDARSRALAVLLEVEAGRFATHVLGPDDDRFTRELVLGVLRRRGTLDAVCAAFGARPLDELDPAVRQTLRLGIYQALFLDGVPPHAVVSATVNVISGPGRAYVNAVLRTLLRESRRVPEVEDRGGASPRKRLHRPGRNVTFFSRPVFPDPEQDRAGYLAALHSHPRELVERWVARLGEERAVARMTAANEPAALVLRPRAGRVSAEQLADRLGREGVACQVLEREDAPPAVLVRPGSGRVLSGPSFAAGLYSVQDAAQMDAAEILDPRAGEHVWDACAAPGGKAGQLAERLELAHAAAPGLARGELLATDASPERLGLLEQSVRRLGLVDLRVAVHDLLSDAPPPGRPARGFDAILLDAPCSNTAVLGRRPEARWRLRPETYGELAALQRRLIDAARRQLAPGGRLVYSVCTFEPEETVEHGLRPTRSPLVWTDRAP
jgi:16S rRNA (cytosine967-C5)-methyltransferase